MYNNHTQLEAFYSYVKAELSAFNVVMIKPINEHIIERANMRGFDTSVIAKVIIEGVKRNIKFLDSKVKELPHTVSFNYKDVSIIMKVRRGEKDGRLLFFIRTCYAFDNVKRTVHSFSVYL